MEIKVLINTYFGVKTLNVITHTNMLLKKKSIYTEAIDNGAMKQIVINIDHRSIPNTRSLRSFVVSEYRNLGSCPMYWLKKGESFNDLFTWCAIIKCQQQTSFLKLTEKESEMKEWQALGQLCPLKPPSSFSCWLATAPATQAPGPCTSCKLFQMERQPHKMTKVSPRRKNNNKFIYTYALKWILTWVASREKRMH